MTDHERAWPQERQRCAARRPRKGEADQRRHHLIEVATDLFLEAGYHRVSLARIPSEARVAVRSIYNNFGGKAGLFEAVLRAGRARFLNDAAVLDPAAGSVSEVLQRFGLQYPRFLSDPQVARMRRILLAEASASDELARAFHEAGAGLTRALLERYFSDERVRQQIRADVPVAVLPSYFIACIAGDWLWPATVDGAPPCDQNLQQQLSARFALFSRAALIHLSTLPP